MSKFPFSPESPATLRELIVAIEGYRCQLDEWASRTDVNLERLRDGLQARLDAVKP
jgi:hypothetical protein